MPNYNEDTLRSVATSLQHEKLDTGFIVDCSHGNSQKEYERQILVALYTKRIWAQKKYPLRGIMLESNMQKGNQPLSKNLKEGVSITDACIDFTSTCLLFDCLNAQDTKTCSTIQEIRESIRMQDSCIYRILHGDLNLRFQQIPSLFHYEEDASIFEICRGYSSREFLFIAISIRLSYANRMAELKFAQEPHRFLDSDHMSLLTDRSMEQEIMSLFPDPLFPKIIELSKRIQLRCIASLIATKVESNTQ
jgi:hypothetical protein